MIHDEDAALQIRISLRRLPGSTRCCCTGLDVTRQGAFIDVVFLALKKKILLNGRIDTWTTSKETNSDFTQFHSQSSHELTMSSNSLSNGRADDQFRAQLSNSGHQTGMADYEAERLENVKHKERLLAELKLDSNRGSKRDDQGAKSRTFARKRHRSAERAPSRISSRIAASGTRPNYKDDRGKRDHFVERRARRRSQSQSRRPGAAGSKHEQASGQDVQENLMSPLGAKDEENLREGWSNWVPTGPAPTRDDNGTFHFEDFPDFQPNKSPEEIIRQGAFGGAYFRPLQSRRLGILIEDDWRELPESWCRGLSVSRYLTSSTYDPEVNKFKVACGQSIEEWEAAGWIAHEYDIRGWFQWYCRFFQGRRCRDDERQVSRWRKCVGESGRWRRMLLKKYRGLGVREVFDDGMDDEAPVVSPVIHQTCHHWAFEVRQHTLDEFWATAT